MLVQASPPATSPLIQHLLRRRIVKNVSYEEMQTLDNTQGDASQSLLLGPDIAASDIKGEKCEITVVPLAYSW